MQVGFLRIVTDRATFAWVCDVYVEPAARGQGIGKLLMAEARPARTTGRAPGDAGHRHAHGLYEQYGFTLIRTTRAAGWSARTQ